jgi:hypothetical protein
MPKQFRSFLDKLIGTDWKTTIGGCIAAVGLTISGFSGKDVAGNDSPWKMKGLIIAAVGMALTGRAAKQEDGK